MEEDTTGALALVAYEDGEPMGLLLATMNEDCARRTAISLHPDAHGLAVGYTLLKALRVTLTAHGVDACAFSVRRADLPVRQALAVHRALEIHRPAPADGNDHSIEAHLTPVELRVSPPISGDLSGETAGTV